MTFEEFLKKLSEQPLPEHPVTKAKTLARELAEGAMLGFLSFNYNIYDRSDVFYLLESTIGVYQEAIQEYRKTRWNNLNPSLTSLEALGYLEPLPKSNYSEMHVSRLSQAAILLTTTSLNRVFISYRRKESSAVALLIKTHLDISGIQIFLDVSGLGPGDKWHGKLEETVRTTEYFVVLLGKETLDSRYVCAEIKWALDSNSIIIPICHPNFDLGKVQTAADMNVLAELKTYNAIRILEENPAEYQKALFELDNRLQLGI